MFRGYFECPLFFDKTYPLVYFLHLIHYYQKSF